MNIHGNALSKYLSFNIYSNDLWQIFFLLRIKWYYKKITNKKQQQENNNIIKSILFRECFSTSKQIEIM